MNVPGHPDLPPAAPSLLPNVLQPRTALFVKEVEDKGDATETIRGFM